MEFKIGKHTLQTVVLCESFRHQTNGVLGAGSKRTAGAGFASGEMIKNHALTDVCPTNHCDDKECLFAQLRHKFLSQDFKPFPAGKRRLLKKGGRAFQLG